MFRIHLTRFLVLGAVTVLIGCKSSGGSGGTCSTCGDKPGMFSRFRTTSSTPVVIPGGECCDRGGPVTGPYLPPQGQMQLPPQGQVQLPQQQPGMILPAPQPNGNVPRIEENGKQMPWDPKMSGRPLPGTKTGDTRTIKDGI